MTATIFQNISYLNTKFMKSLAPITAQVHSVHFGPTIKKQLCVWDACLSQQHHYVRKCVLQAQRVSH